MGRNRLANALGDAANAVLAAAGYNFRQLLAWLTIRLLAWLAPIIAIAKAQPDNTVLAQSEFFTQD